MADPSPQAEAQVGAVTVALELASTVSYALHQNDVPVIHSLRISNATHEPLTDIAIRLSTDPPVAATWERQVARVEPEQTYDLGIVDLLLEHAYLSTLARRLRVRRVGTGQSREGPNGQDLSLELHPGGQWKRLRGWGRRRPIV